MRYPQFVTIQSFYKKHSFLRHHKVLFIIGLEVLGILLCVYYLRQPLYQKYILHEPQAYPISQMENTKRYAISENDFVVGKGQPNTTIKLFFSPNIVKKTVKVSPKGNWVAQLPSTLQNQKYRLTWVNLDQKTILSVNSTKVRVKSANRLMENGLIKNLNRVFQSLNVKAQTTPLDIGILASEYQKAGIYLYCERDGQTTDCSNTEDILFTNREGIEAICNDPEKRPYGCLLPIQNSTETIDQLESAQTDFLRLLLVKLKDNGYAPLKALETPWFPEIREIFAEDSALANTQSESGVDSITADELSRFIQETATEVGFMDDRNDQDFGTFYRGLYTVGDPIFATKALTQCAAKIPKLKPIEDSVYLRCIITPISIITMIKPGLLDDLITGNYGRFTPLFQAADDALAFIPSALEKSQTIPFNVVQDNLRMQLSTFLPTETLLEEIAPPSQLERDLLRYQDGDTAETEVEVMLPTCDFDQSYNECISVLP